MNQAIVNGRTYQVPGKFHELSTAQYVAVVGLLHAGLSRLELKLRLTLVLLDAAKRPLLYRQLHRMSDGQRHDLTELATFLLQEPRFTQQLLPEVRVPGRIRRLYGPAASLGNLTFAEFIEAEGHFAAYPANPAALDQLVATLYRPAGGDNPADRRQAYAPHEVAARVPLVAQLPAATRLAVRFWYASCRAAWARKYSGTLFTVPTEGTPPATKPGNPRETWREILAERAGSPLHYEEYGQQPLPNIFFDLDLRIRRRQEDQEALKNSRS